MKHFADLYYVVCVAGLVVLSLLEYGVVGRGGIVARRLSIVITGFLLGFAVVAVAYVLTQGGLP